MSHSKGTPPPGTGASSRTKSAACSSMERTDGLPAATDLGHGVHAGGEGGGDLRGFVAVELGGVEAQQRP